MSKLNSIQKDIVSKLTKYNYLSFSELMNNNIRSSLFNYHLKELEKKCIIQKTGKRYELTKTGKQFSARLDEKNILDQPISIMLILIKKGDKILRSKSLKEPFKDYWGFSFFTRMRSGLGLEDYKQKVFKRTGLKLNKMQFKGILNLKSISNDHLDYQHLSHVYYCEDFSGDLIKQTDRENKWVKISEFKDYLSFPENDALTQIVLNENNFSLEITRDLDKNVLNSVTRV